MSKQTQANAIVEAGKKAGLDRQTMIEEICAQTGCAGGYATTLFRNAASANATSEPSTADGKMAKFTEANLRKCRTDIEAALAAIGQEHGISIDMGRITFNPDRMSFNTKLAVSIGSEEDEARRTWNKYCSSYGFSQSDFGKTFQSSQGLMTIIGINTRAKKFPIEAKDSRGKEFGYPTEGVLRHISK